MQSKSDRIKVPEFTTESEEAKWWDDHKEMVEENLIQAIRNGTARRAARSKQRLNPNALVPPSPKAGGSDRRRR